MENIDVYPFISLCTPTYNRRPFIQNMFECYRNQTYPKDKIEWIIIDDGTDKIEDLILLSNIPEIRYYKIDEKMSLSDKRNYMHTFIKGDIVIYIDDDDYYPPERVSHSVKTLLDNPNALCAGSSEIYVYFKNIQKMVQFGPYNDNHATAGTFAFRKELLEQTKYETDKEFSEEQGFLKGFSIPMVQLDPLKTILVFAHKHNTIDKYEVYKKGGMYVKDSEKTVEMFIKNEGEEDIKDFFLNKIDDLLDNYNDGSIINKPNTVKQLNDEMIKQKELLTKPLLLVQSDNSTVELTNVDILNIINLQQDHIKKFIEKINEMEKEKLIYKEPQTNQTVVLKNTDILQIITVQQNNIKQLTEKNIQLVSELNKLKYADNYAENSLNDKYLFHKYNVKNSLEFAVAKHNSSNYDDK